MIHENIFWFLGEKLPEIFPPELEESDTKAGARFEMEPFEIAVVIEVAKIAVMVVMMMILVQILIMIMVMMMIVVVVVATVDVMMVMMMICCSGNYFF